MKKTISMLLSALLILSLFQISVMSASADTAYSFNALQFDSSNLETNVSSPYYGRCNVANPNNSTVYENFIFMRPGSSITDTLTGNKGTSGSSELSPSVGDYITFTLPSNINAGEYNLKLYTRDLTTRSVCTLYINDTETMDIDFTGAYAHTERDCGTVTIQDTGTVKLKFVVKTAGTSGLYIGKISLIPTSGDHDTVESLSTVSEYKENMLISWSDEFNGDSIDTNIWNFEGSNKHRNDEDQCYLTPEEFADRDNKNLVVQDGYATIKSYKEDYVGKVKQSDGTYADKTYSYTSACIRSDKTDLSDGFSFKNGIAEIRAKIPVGRGIWPAFWCLGMNPETDRAGKWPYYGEIDIFELFGLQKLQSVVHFDNNGTKQSSASGNYSTSSSVLKNLANDFHTYGMLWNETKIMFYVDETVFHTVEITPEYMEEFRNYKMFFLLNTAIDATIAGTIDDSLFANGKSVDYKIDYVRVYQPKTPELEAITDSSVTLKTVKGYEYSMDGVNWQDSPAFSGLSEATDYTFYQRISSNSALSNTNTSEPATFTTEVSGTKATVTVDGTNQRVDINSSFTLPESTVKGFIAYTDGEGNYYNSGDTVTVEKDMTFTSISITLSMLKGASMRLKFPSGLRYYTKIDEQQIANLKSDYNADIQFGTLICPKDLLGENDLTHDIGTQYIDVKYNASIYYTESDIGFTGVVGSVANVKDENANRKFVGRGYATVTIGGITKTVYADYPESNINFVSRSIADISFGVKFDNDCSCTVKTDLYNSLSEELREIIDRYISLRDNVKDPGKDDIF